MRLPVMYASLMIHDLNKHGCLFEAYPDDWQQLQSCLNGQVSIQR